MGDMGEFWRDVGPVLKEEALERKRKRRERNMAILQEAGVRFSERNDGTVLLFRAPGKPPADFYPGTNSWRSAHVTFRGNANSFLRWWATWDQAKQKA